MKELEIDSIGLMVDKSGHIIDANEAASKTFGYKIQELVGRHINFLIPEDMRNRHLIGFSKFMTDAKQAIRCIRVCGVSKAKEVLYLTVSANKTPNGILTIISNATRCETGERNILQKLR